MIYNNFTQARADLLAQFRRAPTLHPQRWQGVDVSKRPEAKMVEVLHPEVRVPISGESLDFHRFDIKPNLPWADDHFSERICGVPINPGVEWANWPWGVSADDFRDEEGTFGPSMIPSHDWAYLAGMIDGEGTIYFREGERWQGVIRVYQKDRGICDQLLGLFKVGKVTSNNEKTKTNIHGKDVDNHCWYWQVNSQLEVRWLLYYVMPFLRIKQGKAKLAFDKVTESLNSKKGDHALKKVWGQDWEPTFNHNYMTRYWPKGENGSRYKGIRYEYGDLGDLIDLLAAEPDTRQAYLPIFFPEDTGTRNPTRKPCTLGYHFILRHGYFHITYYMRSCDFYRHWADDCYLTVRLLLWVLDRLREKQPDTWNTVKPGYFIMHITSLHMFTNDLRVLNKQDKR